MKIDFKLRVKLILTTAAVSVIALGIIGGSFLGG
jgi:thiamine pyrophosphokinase